MAARSGHRPTGPVVVGFDGSRCGRPGRRRRCGRGRSARDRAGRARRRRLRRDCGPTAWRSSTPTLNGPSGGRPSRPVKGSAGPPSAVRTCVVDAVVCPAVESPVITELAGRAQLLVLGGRGRARAALPRRSGRPAPSWPGPSAARSWSASAAGPAGRQLRRRGGGGGRRSRELGGRAAGRRRGVSAAAARPGRRARLRRCVGATPAPVRDLLAAVRPGPQHDPARRPVGPTGWCSPQVRRSTC